MVVTRRGLSAAAWILAAGVCGVLTIREVGVGNAVGAAWSAFAFVISLTGLALELEGAGLP